MRRTEAVIIGGGQAGLALSRCLQDRRVDHVVLERGQIAERWRSERWDSLRLLSPNWQTRLPGYRYGGPDPDGYMTMSQVVRYFEAYARSFDAPVEAATRVLGVEREDAGGYRVTTDRGTWRAASVVIATGHCDVPLVPRFAARLSPGIQQLSPSRYRSPAQLPSGGVLVVGASASGVQLADELRASGRQVFLSAGRHTRLPRRYRGRDILRWLDAMGILDETADQVWDLEASKRAPSFQLVGRPDHSSLDLGILQARGVRLVGTTVDCDGSRVTLCDDLAATVARSDAKLARLLSRIEGFVARAGLASEVEDPEPISPVRPEAAPAALDLRAEGISTVVWATGFLRRYDWLRVPVLDARGELRHAGGITDSPGLYAIGLRFLRRRNSSFIDGVGADAFELSAHIAGHLGRDARAA
jgi:putative flavoprotein involved in K+ transport